MKKSILILLVILSLGSVKGQKNRYRFAASYFGLSTEFEPQQNSFSYLDDSGNLKSGKLPTQFTPRILIGGTHFWNHADFYISFPMGNFRLKGSSKAKLSNDVLTGFRVIPFQLKQNRFRPFVGLGFHSKEYRQEGANGQSGLYTNWQWFYEGGLIYTHKKRSLFGVEMRYFPKNDYRVFYDRNRVQNVSTAPYSFTLSYKLLFDFSSGYISEGSKRFFKQMKADLEKEKNLNTYSIGIGVSALIPLEKSQHASRLPFFNDEIEGNIFPEVGFAYYHHRLDASARVSYRPLQQKEETYDYEYNLRNHSIAVEAFKFIADFHGFVPFVGPYVSRDFYHLKETDNGQKVTDLKSTKTGYGIVFGWDIRFTETDHFTLRTNLRYTPDFGYKADGYNYTSKGLEFNFIQVVFYPERMKVYKRLNR